MADRPEGLKDFRGKVAVITGGASGIGFALAAALAREGARLVLADIEPAPLAAAVEKLVGTGAVVIGVRTDVADLDSMRALADRTFDRFGAAHIVANNAGVAVFGPTQTMSHDDWRWLINVNLWGPIHGVEAFAPRMLEQGEGGALLFTSSFAGIVPNRYLGPYNVTKAGVVALAESLRKDLRGAGIGVSVLCPMRVETNVRDSERNRPEALKRNTKSISYDQRGELQGRTLEVGAVADLVLRGLRSNQLFIHTHKEARPLFRARAARIEAAFDDAL